MTTLIINGKVVWVKDTVFKTWARWVLELLTTAGNNSTRLATTAYVDANHGISIAGGTAVVTSG